MPSVSKSRLMSSFETIRYGLLFLMMRINGVGFRNFFSKEIFTKALMNAGTYSNPA